MKKKMKWPVVASSLLIPLFDFFDDAFVDDRRIDARHVTLRPFFELRRIVSRHWHSSSCQAEDFGLFLQNLRHHPLPPGLPLGNGNGQFNVWRRHRDFGGHPALDTLQSFIKWRHTLPKEFN